MLKLYFLPGNIFSLRWITNGTDGALVMPVVWKFNRKQAQVIVR
jgi:hypothetical protein